MLQLPANLVQNKSKKSQVCSRCRKTSHSREQCFATRDVDGNERKDVPACDGPEWYKNQRKQRTAMLVTKAGITEDQLADCSPYSLIKQREQVFYVDLHNSTKCS